MTLGDLISVLNCIDITIMENDNESGEITPLFEGKSDYFRMSEMESFMNVLFIAPHRFRSGGIFVMVER